MRGLKQRASSRRVVVFTVSLAAVLALGYLDALTGMQFTFSVLFLAPIAWTTANVGRRPGIVLAAVSAAIWPVAVVLSTETPLPSGPLYWMSAARLLAFVLVVYIVAGLGRRRQIEEARVLAEYNRHERQRLAQELHDTLLQELTGLRMHAANLKRKLAARGAPETADVDTLLEHLTEAATQARRIMEGLKPVELGSHDLVPALERTVRQFRHMYPLEFELHTDDIPPLRDSGVAEHLFLMAREALLNAAKHSSGSRVEVTLENRDGLLTLEVRDDGAGLPRDYGRGGGAGLSSLWQRARVIGAKLFVEPNVPNGTTVRCVVPAYRAFVVPDDANPLERWRYRAR
jgi:two-component system, LuxR family, sensor kinase FixL